MDEDGLPLMGSGIDLTKVPAIQQKRTVAFLNQFVVHTVQFLNRFSTVCEEKLADLSLRIQQIETTLNILDAKLSSIPGLDDVAFEVSTVSATGITNESHSETTAEKSQQNSLQDSGPQESEVTPENILTVAKDPRYARYLKMVQVGVPVMAIRNKMISEGLDPDLLEIHRLASGPAQQEMKFMMVTAHPKADSRNGLHIQILPCHCLAI
uniref:WASH complex subunit 3 n=2 Tax=Felinae TaxID=338152 RepID=A0ABI7XRS6_FELCA